MTAACVLDGVLLLYVQHIEMEVYHSFSSFFCVSSLQFNNHISI